MDRLEAVFLDFSGRKLKQTSDHIQLCLDALTDDQIWARANESSNSIGNLVLHLAGNIRQWIVSGAGGAANVRQRDLEFSTRQMGRAELSQTLKKSVDDSLGTLRSLPPGRLLDSLEIQGFRVTSLEAIYHAVEHFSGHGFQIILLTKAYRAEPLEFYSFLSGPHETETP